MQTFTSSKAVDPEGHQVKMQLYFGTATNSKPAGIEVSINENSTFTVFVTNSAVAGNYMLYVILSDGLLTSSY